MVNGLVSIHTTGCLVCYIIYCSVSIIHISCFSYFILSSKFCKQTTTKKSNYRTTALTIISIIHSPDSALSVGQDCIQLIQSNISSVQANRQKRSTSPIKKQVQMLVRPWFQNTCKILVHWIYQSSSLVNLYHSHPHRFQANKINNFLIHT